MKHQTVEDFLAANGSHVCDCWPCNKPGAHHIPNGKWPYPDEPGWGRNYKESEVARLQNEARQKDRARSPEAKAKARAVIDAQRQRMDVARKVKQARAAEIRIAAIKPFDGCSTREIMDALGWPERTIRDWAKRAGITLRNTRQGERDLAASVKVKARALVDAGHSQAEVARVLHVSARQVRRVIEKTGGQNRQPFKSERVVELAHAGKTVAEIADELVTTRRYVRTVLAEANVEAKKPRTPNEVAALVIGLAEAGKGASEISRDIGLSRRHVRRIISDFRPDLARPHGLRHTGKVTPLEIRQAIADDLRAGLKWREAAEKHDVTMDVVNRVSRMVRREGMMEAAE